MSPANPGMDASNPCRHDDYLCDGLLQDLEFLAAFINQSARSRLPLTWKKKCVRNFYLPQLFKPESLFLTFLNIWARQCVLSSSQYWQVFWFS
jgi:hypothetical protein